jgi:hypothetical protein
MCPFKKHNFLSALFGQSQVIQKVGLTGQSPVRAWEFVFYLESRALTVPPDIDLPYMHLSRRGGGSMQSPEIGATFVQLFYDNMINLATDLVQQFSTYWQIPHNQAALIVSLKKLFYNFLDEIILKGWKKCMDSGEPIKTDDSHRHNTL